MNKRSEFQEEFFKALLERWLHLEVQPQALLIEDSPWAYLCRHAVHVPADVRQRCHLAMTHLRHPDFTIVLGSSGVEVGRRHPAHHLAPEAHSPAALRQMQQLQFHPSPAFHVDATPPPVALVKRVHALLSKRAFRVQAANFEGMSYLEKLGAVMQPSEGAHFAKQVCLQRFCSSGLGLQKLHRLGEIINFHPEIVNTGLASHIKGLY